MNDVLAVKQAADAALDDNVAELRALCRIPSRRWEPEAMHRASDFVESAIKRHGGSARQVPWPETFPYVLGEMRSPDPHAATLLHYNHYDVEIEPAGDDSDLLHPPFAAEVHDGAIYARGVADDKAPLMSRIHAASAFRAAGVDLPVTVRYLHEGKQRLNSPGLVSFVNAHRDELNADGVCWENSWVDTDGRPLLKLGEKGLLYVRLHIRRLRRDGSSQNSAVLPHASRELIGALASLHAPDGTVAITGFHDDVRTLDADELALLDHVPFESDRLMAAMGIDTLDRRLDPAGAARAVRLEPTVTVSGLSAGDSSDGVTLNLPADAVAKVEIRLVPNQEPEVVLRQLRAHLDRHGHEAVEIEVLGTTRPHRTPHTDPFVGIVSRAAQRAYDRPAVVEPATPLVGNQACFAGTPVVGIGVGRAWSASDPNQHVFIEDYRRAVHHVIEIMAGMADASR